MDQSITPRMRVYQHHPAVRQSPSVDLSPRLCELSLLALIHEVNNRIAETEGLDFVDKHTLFTLYVNIDNELQARRDAMEDALMVNSGIEHAVNPLGNGLDGDDEHVHASEITMAEWEAVRAIHAEVYSDED